MCVVYPEIKERNLLITERY